MKKTLMITSLTDRRDNGEINYYYFKDGSKMMYVDALTPTEASCKYILSNYDIDMILTFGSESTYDPGDDVKSMLLDEGKSFYAVDNTKMSSYSLLRYRLPEYLDDINAEMQDTNELLDSKYHTEAKTFIKDFIRANSELSGKKRLNKFFNCLASNNELRDLYNEQIEEAAKKLKIDSNTFKKWVTHYIYNEYIDYGKMHLLDGNEDVRIRFLSSGIEDDNGLAFADLLIQNLQMITKMTEIEDVTEVDVYLCLQNDNSKDNFVLSSLLEMIKSIPNSNINVSKVIMTDSYSNNVALHIYDDTEKNQLTDLISGIKAFLKYGKTDMLLDSKNTLHINNPEIDGVLYAMKNIDTGISLCDITDIERGINSLRQYFSNYQKLDGDSFVEKYFNVIVSAIRQDFGPLLTSEKIEFIDLVKWAYRKGFWQQTLTLIESRAPREFIDKGIYYYADDENSREEAVKKFGIIYYNLKPHEKYKLKDIAHYYVKFYSRARVGHKDDNKAYQLDYARARVEEIGTTSEELICAHTQCPDLDLLRDLLFSYYYIGDVRNATNHAEDEFSGFLSIMEDSDISERMNLIKHSVDYFIYCYEKVVALLGENEQSKNIINIETSELVEFAKKYRFEVRDSIKNDKDNDNKDKGTQNKRPPRRNNKNNKSNKDSDSVKK